MHGLARTAALAAAVLTFPGALAAQRLEAARPAVEARLRASGAEAVGVYARDLGRADSLLLGAATRFHAASMMKVPVLIQVYRDVDAGRLRLDQRIPVVNAFASLVDGSPYHLDAGDDGDSTLYSRVADLAGLVHGAVAPR